MKTVLIVAALLAAFVGVSTMDYYDAVAREEEMKQVVKFVRHACIPTKLNQRTITKLRADGSLQCSTYEGAALVYAEASSQ